MDSTSESQYVREGEHVLIQVNGEKHAMVQVNSSTSFRAERRVRISCDSIIGHPVGSVFKLVEGSKLERISAKEALCNSTNRDITKLIPIDDPSFVPERDNRSIVDLHGEAQGLSAEEILQMKGKLNADELVSKIAEKSSSFSLKTEFAQEKYLKKKKRKFTTEVKITKNTASSLSEAYFSKKADKVLGLRPDTLALLLTRANIRPFSQVMILDTCCGLVTSAIAERMGGYGRILAGYCGPCAAPECVRMLNFSDEIYGTIINFPMKVLAEIQPIQSSRIAPEEVALYVSTDKNSDSDADQKMKSTKSGRVLLPEPEKDVLHRWIAEGSDSLVVISHFDPKDVVSKMIQFLVPGGSLVVYSPIIEPLSLLSQLLKDSGLALNVQISENWYREYQVLSGRTHPMMSMSGSGGYLLSAIKNHPVRDFPAGSKDNI